MRYGGYGTDTVRYVQPEDTAIRYGTGFYKNPYLRIDLRIT